MLVRKKRKPVIYVLGLLVRASLERAVDDPQAKAAPNA